MDQPDDDVSHPPVTELTKGQRRVLGTLLEKAFTTPEAYPLTVKALTTGSNQKSNRHPMTEYSEDDVLEFLDQLRQLGLVAVVHTESGRTERFRHYMRKRFPWNEPQLAVMTELLLRGRQSIGDLRARASRMVPIESLDELREALRGLMEQKYVQSTGALERRGVEVDHGFYAPSEQKALAWEAGGEQDSAPEAARPAGTDALPRRAAETASQMSESSLARLSDEQRDLRARLDSLEEEVRRLASSVDSLVRDLRG